MYHWTTTKNENLLFIIYSKKKWILFKIFFKGIKIIFLIRIVPRIIQMQLVITKGWFLVQLLEIVQQLFIPIFFYRAPGFRAKIWSKSLQIIYLRYERYFQKESSKAVIRINLKEKENKKSEIDLTKNRWVFLLIKEAKRFDTYVL